MRNKKKELDSMKRKKLGKKGKIFSKLFCCVYASVNILKMNQHKI
jgi:hypothetical protein